jgi:cystathionine beta-synthase
LETPNSIYINQYFNELNIDAHYQTTGPEIWEQTEGKITHLFACTGTGGTLSGSAKFLKEKIRILKLSVWMQMDLY